MKKNLSSLTVAVACVLFWMGCSGSGSMTSQMDTPEPDQESIRVLMVTATHGFRHDPAIDASKAVATAMQADGEFMFDITEDINDFNDEKLSGYDVLFFANSTLRAADDFSESEMQAVADPMEGDWGNYNFEYTSPRGTTEGTLAFSGPPDAMTGNILAGNALAPVELENISLNGDQLIFGWSAGNFGSFLVETTLDADRNMEGVARIRDFEFPFTATRTGPNEDDVVEGPRVTAEQRAAIMNFVKSGKGVVVAHAGLDAFYNWQEYRDMVGGGLFDSHPWTQEVSVVIEEPTNPSVSHFGDSFRIHDEIYVLEDNPRWNARVLASLDMSSVVEDDAPAGPEVNDHPISWIRNHEGGKVFVTKLGHFPEVWQNADFQQHIAQGIRMVAGEVEADFAGRRVKEVLSEGVWPDDIAVDERGNVWIAELRGKVHLYEAATGETRLLAELPTTEPTGIEHGLYGIEVDPNFYNGEPYLYLYLAEQETFINTLYRYDFRNGEIDFSTEKVILRVPTEPQCCHQAGDLEWGPDGTLFISTGDTGYSGTRPVWGITEEDIAAFEAGHNLKGHHWSRLVDSERSAQNLADLRGKILRINKDGSIPKDNPFYGQPGVRWEIYAYGLRNPYRFKVDDRNGALYIGVVGPDAGYDYDEYNISEEGGENFGWPRSIGKLFYNEWTPDMIENFTPPIWEYTYASGGRSATVGPIYRFEGTGSFPQVFQDKIFVYDWARRWIKWGELTDGTFENDQVEDVRNETLRVNMPAKRLRNVKLFDQLTLTTPISMELGPDGSLYVAEYDGFWDPGPNARVTRYRWVEE